MASVVRTVKGEPVPIKAWQTAVVKKYLEQTGRMMFATVQEVRKMLDEHGLRHHTADFSNIKLSPPEGYNPPPSAMA